MDQNQQQEDKLCLELIPANQLHEYLLKPVVYKETESCYRDGTLGQQIAGSNYYKVYIGNDSGSGICVPSNKIYKRLSENSIKKK